MIDKTPRIYLVIAVVFFILAVVVAGITQVRLMASFAGPLWSLAGFSAFVGCLMVLVWNTLRAKISAK